jgi:hypothetical protein
VVGALGPSNPALSLSSLERIGDAMKEQTKTEDDLVDWLTLTPVLKAERAAMVEAFGTALGSHGDELLNEVEAMIDAKLATIRNELATMVTTQIAMLLQQQAQLRADTETKMTALRKDVGSDDRGVVHLPNPLGKRERKTREQQSIQ